MKRWLRGIGGWRQQTGLHWAEDDAVITVKADPANSYLLKQQLLAEAEGKDAHLLETLTALWSQIEPIIALVKQKHRVDLDAIAGQLKTAVEQQKWPQVVASANVINNVIKPEEWVRSDLRRLNRHLLEAAFRQATGRPCFRRLNSGLDGVLVSDVGKPFEVKTQQRAGGLTSRAGAQGEHS